MSQVAESDARDATRPPLLSVEHLSVRAGRRRIVDDVSFSAHAGEVTAVIGPNGAGKTSLFEAIVGLRSADSGHVRVSGAELSTFGARARAYAFLPDQCQLAAEASARTLLDHALRSATAELPVSELMRLLAVEPLLDSGAGVLSRGERQRLLLCATLVLGRPIVVLDEPFSAFDPLQLRDVQRAVRCVVGTGAAIVASIHQLADAERIADRVLLVADGRTVAFGTLPELRSQAGGQDMALGEMFVTLLTRRKRAA